ncbi:MAG: hypothetical protein VZR36_00365 [Prevotella sp.]|nr:hypothetical protein [Prevotella sp.]
MEQKSPKNKPNLKHQAASNYTEDQARLLFAMRDMVRAEVKRQLKELLK